MKVDEIRDSFLDFFRKKGHAIVASDSLVPQNDPTLLFTGAGMNQFKDYFLGVKKDLKRAASSQKCLRTGDLEEVGRTPYHHSFFEMLGNFSFGDYFKEEAIAWAWEYLTGNLKIAKERLRISVHQKDVEAFAIWRDKIKIRENWIHKLGDKGNFWPANAPADGPNGPCGPCSEIYYDQDPNSKSEDIGSSRFAEIWNLVFTQYDRQDGGKLVPLAQKNIDTGMGLERLACVLQEKKSNFKIDIFEPIIASISENLTAYDLISTQAGLPKFTREKNLHRIADHSRAIVFALADGVVPSNEGRGYVIRKLIRRAIWQGYELTVTKLDRPFLYKLVPTIASVMQRAYPELKQSEESISHILRGEEERFLDTLETGLNILHNRLAPLRKNKSTAVPGEIVFELYDTYGFPDELTRAIAESEGFTIDQKGFDALMESQRKRGKDATQIASAIFVTSEFEKKLAALPATKFLGYETLDATGRVLLADIRGNKGIVVLDQTSFYGESGGQVGDHGILQGKSFKARVIDSQKKDHYILHAIEIEQGAIKEGAEVQVKVDRTRRERAMRNHTATHLLHAALRELLGKQVRQLGSLVSPEKLRFDYSYSEPLRPEQIKAIEDSVNEQILKDIAVSKEEKPVEEAKKEGAIAFFGEKYGAWVRIVTVPGFSKEFCGGTHCDRTGQIGAFVITSESSIASGTRRIEALTGEGALDYLRGLRNQVTQLAQTLKTTPDELNHRVAKLQDSIKKMEKEKKQGALAKVDPKKILGDAKAAGQIRFASYVENGMPIDELRSLSDGLRQQGSQVVYLLGAQNEDKMHLLLGMTPDLSKTNLDVRDLWKEISSLLNASGGGRKDFVQGGAQNPEKIRGQWNQILDLAIRHLQQKKIS